MNLRKIFFSLIFGIILSYAILKYNIPLFPLFIFPVIYLALETTTFEGCLIGGVFYVWASVLIGVYFKKQTSIIFSPSKLLHYWVLPLFLFVGTGFVLGKINEIRIFYEKELKRKIDKFKKESERRLKELKEKEKMAYEREKLAKEKMKELEKARVALMSLLEDVDEEREKAEKRAKELEKARVALMSLLEDVDEERKKVLAVFENFTDGLLLLNEKGEILMANPVFKESFNISQKISGKKLNIFFENELLKEGIKKILKNGNIKKVYREEFRAGKKTYEITTVPLKNIGWLLIFHDITREKFLDQMKSQFVSISAHQLRTPLSAIKWALALLKDKTIPLKEKTEIIEKLSESTERMIKLVNDLLNVSRIEEGRFLYKPKKEDLREIVKTIFDQEKEIAQKKNITFNLFLPKEPCFSLVDKEKISLAVQNLIENAIHYTPPGGKVEVFLEKKEKELIFKVKDTGIGIPEEEQKRIFEKFFRGSNALKMETSGSGLGLFITKNIIEAHKGKIWFESKVGKGTTFYFSLPLC